MNEIIFESTKIQELIEKYPNDQELGKAIRSYYTYLKDNIKEKKIIKDEN